MYQIPPNLRPLLDPAVQKVLGIVLALIAVLGIGGVGLSSDIEKQSDVVPSSPEAKPPSSSAVNPEPTFEPTAEPEEPTTSPEPEPQIPAVDNRDTLVNAGLQQRGEQIGTGGKPAVALRFDHHLEEFESQVLPLLQKYRLPWGQMINAGNVSNSESYTFAELASMTHNNGGEIWNHGWSHSSIYSEEEADREITQGLEDLRAGLPSLWIDGWAQPGQADYLGLSGTPFTPEHYYDTYPGRLVIGQHAFVRGYYPNPYHELNGDNFIGQAHVTIDKQTGDRINAYVRRAINGDTGVTLMLHPNYLDEPGYLTTQELDSSLAYIARLRDRDEIEVLSNTGILMADDDLAEDFGNLLDEGPAVEIEEAWRSDVPRAINHLGIPQEAEVWVTGSGTATLTVQVDSGSFPVTAKHSVELTNQPQRMSVLVTPPRDTESVTLSLEGNLRHDGLSYQPL